MVLDDPFAFYIQFITFKKKTRNWTSERIAKQLHFRLPIGDFTPSALRNAR